jgi:hypothetical protein
MGPSAFMYGREGSHPGAPTEHARSRWASRLFSVLGGAALAFVALFFFCQASDPVTILHLGDSATDNITGELRRLLQAPAMLVAG